MTTEPVTVRLDWPLSRAILAMEKAGVNGTLVVNSDGRPVGMLTRDDAIRSLARRFGVVAFGRSGEDAGSW